MSRPAYYGRPALVARYPWPRAPLGVQVVALFEYLAGLLTLVAAGLATLIARDSTHYAALNGLPESVRRGVAGAGLVIPVALTVIGLCWLVIARNLQRGRPWARDSVLVLSLLGVAGTLCDVWLSRDPDVLAALALPVLNLLLLNTQAARSWFRYGA
jgi:hypothetical protein